MVIQEECENIIMLCNIMEKGMLKCSQYWPANDGQNETYGDVEVTNEGVCITMKVEYGKILANQRRRNDELSLNLTIIEGVC